MAEGAPSPARLEAFSDGVIAVIITVMVLEIKVPHEDGFESLRHMAPALAIYFLSFTFTAIYWLNHQHIVRRTVKAEYGMQCANLGFLFCLSLMPVSTAYVVDKALSGFGVAVYSASLFVVALSFMFLRLAVHGHLNRRQALEDRDRTGLRNHLICMCVYAVSVAAGFFYPKTILTLIGLLTLFWALPNMSPKEVRR